MACHGEPEHLKVVQYVDKNARFHPLIHVQLEVDRV